MINLGRTQVTDDVLPALVAHGNVSRLYLGQTSITDDGLETLSSLLAKRILVRDTDVSAEGVTRLRELLPDAEVIWNDSPLTRDEAITRVIELGGTVGVAGNGSADLQNRSVTSATDISDEEWPWLWIVLGNADGVTADDLRQILSALPTPVLLDLPHSGATTALLPIVVELCRSNEGPDDAAGEVRAEGERRSGLIRIGLTIDAVDDDIRQLQEFRWLQGVELNSEKGLTDEALRILSRHPNIHDFRGLLIQETQITDEGLQAFCEQAPSLRALNLNKTGITDIGVQYLAELPALSSLYLMSTEITDAALTALMNADLGRLSIRDTDISEAALLRFHEQHPNCSINRDGGIMGPGSGNYALQFDGIDDYVDTFLHYDGTHPITVECWLVPSVQTGVPALICDAQGADCHSSCRGAVSGAL